MSSLVKPTGIQIFHDIPVFTERQIEMQTEKQVRFLQTIFPFLCDHESWNDGAIEIRPILREKGKKKGYIKSYNAWHMEEKDVAALGKLLNFVNGKGYCQYYSTFAFDYEKETFRADGKPYQKGKVNTQNALYTTILPMDFDGITEMEFHAEKKKLIDLGLETIDIFTGHGFQSIILLEHRVMDTDILRKFTTLLLAKGLRVDPAIVDSARVLRMPYSFNCKALDPTSKYYDEFFPEIFPTTDRAWTEKRYHVADVFSRIQSLPDVIPTGKSMTAMERDGIPTAPITATKKREKNIEIKEVGKIKISSLRVEYPMLDFEILPEPVQKMLGGSQDGLRNRVMMFLVPFLRNTIGMSQAQIVQVMNIWGSKCTPQLSEGHIEAEVRRIYAYGLKSKAGAYTAELRKAYGFLEFTRYTRKNKVCIPNDFFEDFSEMADGAVRIYIAMKLDETLSGEKKTWTQKEIQEIAGISKMTFHRNMKDLLRGRHICKRRANRRVGEEYSYYVNPYFSAVAGFTMLENATIDKMLRELTTGEMKLYSYLCRMMGDAPKECFASQKYLATKIGKKGHDSISKMTDSLHQKRFILKKTEEKDGVLHSTYNLNF